MERITDILNDHGAVIDSISLDEAHEKGLLHKSIHILVIDETGKVFVRRRPADKLMYSGLWTSSVGTHLLIGMDPDTAAQAALQYFLGLEAPVMQIGEQHVHDEFENEIITVYSCSANAVGTLNTSEGSEGAFMTIEQIHQLSEAHQVTPHLLAAVALLQRQPPIN